MASPFRHIVVLMMENRSFDHMLGYLKAPDYPIEGLDGDESNVASDGGSPIRVSPDARSLNDLNPDPSHEFQDINWQIFRNVDGTDTGQPKMQGFVENYAKVSNSAAQGANIMKCFHQESLPVLAALAKQYAICDHWYSSVPASTIPNRLFAHAASSGESLTQDAVLAPATAKTIFEIIGDPSNDADYRIYSSGSTILMANLYLAKHQNKFFDYRTRFLQDCIDNLLPEYTFIEPIYDDDPVNGLFATSQHPDFSVDAGEGLISQVYNAVRRSPEWNDTLLLIVYDEHGGIFDHVTPPTLTRDPQYPPFPPTKDFGFTFDRLGVRVPAVFVSPRISPGTILRQPFDHCSIVATVRKLFCLDKTPFNWREAQAVTFEGIANLADNQIRTDTVQLPQPVASDGNVPMARDLVLTSAERDAADAAIQQAGVVPVMHAVADPFRTAASPPTPSPAPGQPTDLMVLMVQAMQHTLQQAGLSVPAPLGPGFTSAQATQFMQQATAAFAQSGGAQ